MARPGPTPTDGWVYILHNPAWPGHVKVGSASDLKARVSVYQTSSPFRDFALVAAVQVADRRAFERALHADMRGHRVGTTEWFQVHPQDAKNILERLQHKEHA
ncbi:GIY-YIG nuclease family protein [Roseixanthobacter pseudopolyaromaticivorans]|uniref:GIY-YIG nuclease family protein n=1 Tax=Xanthobacteraceae TaxID=335928 RepID=UPI0037273361